jgi:hypothetical protein
MAWAMNMAALMTPEKAINASNMAMILQPSAGT